MNDFGAFKQCCCTSVFDITLACIPGEAQIKSRVLGLPWRRTSHALTMQSEDFGSEMAFDRVEASVAALNVDETLCSEGLESQLSARANKLFIGIQPRG